VTIMSVLNLIKILSTAVKLKLADIHTDKTANPLCVYFMPTVQRIHKIDGNVDV
jgi:hypothetical protein